MPPARLKHNQTHGVYAVSDVDIMAVNTPCAIKSALLPHSGSGSATRASRLKSLAINRAASSNISLFLFEIGKQK